MQLIDTHAHLDMQELYLRLQEVFNRSQEHNIVHIITVGINMESNAMAVSLSETYSFVSATVGVHPHEAHDLSTDEQDNLRKWLSLPHVVGAGEIGLDFYRNYSPRADQIRCFGQQLDIAANARKPIVFHIRNAFPDFFRIVRPFIGHLASGIVHCFSGDWSIAQKCLEMGFFLSIPGVVTYPKALDLHDVVKKAPLESLLLETDAPFLTPVPFRGKINEPAYVYYTAQKIAGLRGESINNIAMITTANAIRAFNLKERKIDQKM